MSFCVQKVGTKQKKYSVFFGIFRIMFPHHNYVFFYRFYMEGTIGLVSDVKNMIFFTADQKHQNLLIGFLIFRSAKLPHGLDAILRGVRFRGNSLDR